MSALSQRSIDILEMCRSATREKPAQKVSFARSWHLREKGLLGYRGFDGGTSGGHFITEAGIAALLRAKGDAHD